MNDPNDRLMTRGQVGTFGFRGDKSAKIDGRIRVFHRPIRNRDEHPRTLRVRGAEFRARCAGRVRQSKRL